MHKALLSLTLCLGCLTAGAQDRGFSIHGNVNLPDGYSVGLVCHTDTAFSVEMANGTIKDGRFLLTGKVDHPLSGTLMTNNLDLIEKNQWPMDSVRWTYTDVFVSNNDIYVDPALNVTGGMVQKDFNEYQAMKGEGRDWTFITSYPSSVVSVYLANNMLQRGYNLTKEQVELLENSITDVPDDPKRMEEFRQRIAYAKKTTKGGSLVDLELKDTKGKVRNLLKVMPQNKFVLVDFWASWCGICIASMPEIKEIAEQYKDKMDVIGVSIDTKEDAWRKAMAKHPEPWPQYITTAKGYKDLFDKYQVGNGVPYYLMVAPDGTVLSSPPAPEDIREIMEKYQ